MNTHHFDKAENNIEMIQISKPRFPLKCGVSSIKKDTCTMFKLPYNWNRLDLPCVTIVSWKSRCA